MAPTIASGRHPAPRRLEFTKQAGLALQSGSRGLRCARRAESANVGVPVVVLLTQKRTDEEMDDL